MNSDNIMVLKSRNISPELLSQLCYCCCISTKIDNNNVISTDILDEEELDELYINLSSIIEDISIYYEEKIDNYTGNYFSSFILNYNENNSNEKVMECYEYYDDIFIEYETKEEVNKYNYLKDEIEEEAKKKNIEIAWDGDIDSIYPREANKDFRELCEKILDDHGGIAGLATTIKRKSLSNKHLENQVDLESMLEIAEEKNYIELKKRILEKLNHIK